MSDEKEKALPKKRFAFKNRPKPTAPEEVPRKPTETINTDNDFVIRKLRNETLIVTKEEYEGKESVYIENVENCDIFLPFVMKALYIKNTYHSRVYAGFVMGASYIETTNKSTYQITSHQVRIHKANEVTF